MIENNLIIKNNYDGQEITCKISIVFACIACIGFYIWFLMENINRLPFLNMEKICRKSWIWKKKMKSRDFSNWLIDDFVNSSSLISICEFLVVLNQPFKLVKITEINNFIIIQFLSLRKLNLAYYLQANWSPKTNLILFHFANFRRDCLYKERSFSG